MWDQGISPTRRRRIYPDANPLFVYPGSGNQRGIYHPPSAGASSREDGRKIKIRGSAISLETASRHGRRLVVCTTPMSEDRGEVVRSCRSSGVAEFSDWADLPENRGGKFISPGNRLLATAFLFLGIVFRSAHHLRIRIVVHESGVSTPGNHGLEDFLGVFIRQRDRDVFHDGILVDFLLHLEVGEDDVEQA